jgi:hypothetical protein
MKTYQTAVRRRGRIGNLLLLALLLALSHHSAAAVPATPVAVPAPAAKVAVPASLQVKIRQINPDSATREVTCAVKKKCLLPIEIKTSQAKTETLTVDISFVPGNVLFTFQTPEGYLYAGDKNAGDKDSVYSTIWHKAPGRDKAATYNVTLFLPAVPHAFAAPILPLTHEAARGVTHQAVADLEFTTQQVP